MMPDDQWPMRPLPMPLSESGLPRRPGVDDVPDTALGTAREQLSGRRVGRTVALCLASRSFCRNPTL